MSKRGPIILVEDDLDDQQLLEEVFLALHVANELRFFDNGQKALDYLQTTSEKPFLIISDVNLPGMSGPDLKKKINEDGKLRRKSIPFVFLTTTADNNAVAKAYDLLVQGYFQKGNKIEELKSMIKMIVEYWTACKNPDE